MASLPSFTTPRRVCTEEDERNARAAPRQDKRDCETHFAECADEVVRRSNTTFGRPHGVLYRVAAGYLRPYAEVRETTPLSSSIPHINVSFFELTRHFSLRYVQSPHTDAMVFVPLAVDLYRGLACTQRPP